MRRSGPIDPIRAGRAPDRERTPKSGFTNPLATTHHPAHRTHETSSPQIRGVTAEPGLPQRPARKSALVAIGAVAFAYQSAGTCMPWLQRVLTIDRMVR